MKLLVPKITFLQWVKLSVYTHHTGHTNRPKEWGTWDYFMLQTLHPISRPHCNPIFESFLVPLCAIYFRTFGVPKSTYRALAVSTYRKITKIKALQSQMTPKSRTMSFDFATFQKQEKHNITKEIFVFGVQIYLPKAAFEFSMPRSSIGPLGRHSIRNITKQPTKPILRAMQRFQKSEFFKKNVFSLERLYSNQLFQWLTLE